MQVEIWPFVRRGPTSKMVRFSAMAGRKEKEKEEKLFRHIQFFFYLESQSSILRGMQIQEGGEKTEERRG